MPTIEYMTCMIGEAQRQIIKGLRTKQIECFEYDGLIFEGTAFAAKLEFVYNNPTGGDFGVWLQDNRKIIGESK